MSAPLRACPLPSSTPGAGRNDPTPSPLNPFMGYLIWILRVRDGRGGAMRWPKTVSSPGWPPSSPGFPGTGWERSAANRERPKAALRAAGRALPSGPGARPPPLGRGSCRQGFWTSRRRGRQAKAISQSKGPGGRLPPPPEGGRGEPGDGKGRAGKALAAGGGGAGEVVSPPTALVGPWGGLGWRYGQGAGKARVAGLRGGGPRPPPPPAGEPPAGASPESSATAPPTGSWPT
jgi:hypothetical protein